MVNTNKCIRFQLHTCLPLTYIKHCHLFIKIWKYERFLLLLKSWENADTLVLRSALDMISLRLKKLLLVGQIGKKAEASWWQVVSPPDCGSEGYRFLSHWCWNSAQDYCIGPNIQTYSYKLTVKQFYFYPLLYKIVCCGYSFELPRLVEAIQWVPTTYDFMKEIREHIT